jgi:hypothetical protein
VVRVIVVLGILVPPAAVQAQVSAGVRVGANMATLSFDQSDFPPELQFDLENMAGLTAGAFVTMPINALLGFQPEVLYSRQGAKMRQSGVTTEMTLDYIRVPLLARVRTGSRSPVAILFGPSMGFKTRASLIEKGTTFDGSDIFDERTETFELGLTAGAAMDAGRLVLDARYTWGLTDIFKPVPDIIPIDLASSDSGNSNRWLNRALSFSAGLRF